MAYMFTIRLLARAPIMIVLSWIMTLTINVPIALLLLAMVPILGGVLIFIAKKHIRILFRCLTSTTCSIIPYRKM